MYEFVLSNITKNMGQYGVLENIDLAVNQGERICLLGPSGCGKTTLLRIAAGLEQPDKGDVIFQGKSIKNIPPHQRNFGMMFQDFALFPHKNIFDNIAFGLEMKKEKKTRIRARVDQMLELVNLEGYGLRRVDELSGGERQRVALARTLAPEPDLVMLDEPLGSLDRLLRERLLADLCTILTQTRVTTIFVTHDQNEAFAAADRICIMIKGRVEQTDTPEQLYNYPGNVRIADFLGFQNILTGEFYQGNNSFLTGEGKFNPVFPDTDHTGDSNTDAGYDLLILPSAATPVCEKKWREKTCNRISGRVSNLFFQGSLIRLVVKTKKGQLFTFDIPPGQRLAKNGELIFLVVSSSGLRLVNKK